MAPRSGQLRVGLAQINNSFSNQNYLPYSVGLLEAYVRSRAADPARYEFLVPLYRRTPVAEAVSMRAVSDAAISGPNHLALTFPRGYYLHMQRCERPEVLSQLQDVATEIAGQPVRISLQLSDEQPVAETENATGSSFGFSKSKSVWLTTVSPSTSIRNRTGNPNPAPMLAKSSWQGRRMICSNDFGESNSTSTHFSTSANAAIWL